MACAGLQICDRERRRLGRSLPWLPLLTLTVIFASLLPSTSSQLNCSDGTYLVNGRGPSSPGWNSGAVTSGPQMETTWSAYCRNCNESIKHCVSCESDGNGIVECSRCATGFDATGGNCTETPPSPPPKSNNSTIIIAVVVSIVGTLIVVGVIVGIVYGVRRGVFEKCQGHCLMSSSPTPPPMPAPDELGVSFSNKNVDHESGTGQRVDLRYTEEPGATQNRVESVHYNDYNGPHSENDDSLYVNSPRRNNNIPDTVLEEDEEYSNTNADPQDDQVYMNTESVSPPNRSIVDTPRQTSSAKVPANNKPPRPRPKPKTSQKPVVAAKTEIPPPVPSDNRGSLFPPDDPHEDIYANEQASEGEDDEDYVNADGYQPGQR